MREMKDRTVWRKSSMVMILLMMGIISLYMLPMHVLAASGTLGTVVWSLEDGTLQLSGSGEVQAGDTETYPWEDVKSEIKWVEIGSGITGFDNHALLGCRNLTEIEVDDDNIYYQSYEGALYSKGRTVLYFVPQGINGKSFCTAYETTTIKTDAIVSLENVTELKITGELKTVEAYAVHGNSINSLYFLSSKKVWRSITIGEGNSDLDCLQEKYVSSEDEIEKNWSSSRIVYIGEPTERGIPVGVWVMTFSTSTKLQKITGVKAVNTVNGQKITWNSDPSADGYEVWGALSKYGGYELLAFVEGVSNTCYVNNDVSSGESYWYKIRSYAEEGNTLEGSFSDLVSMEYLAPVIASDMSIRNTINGVEIDWEPIVGASGYMIYRRNESESKYSEIGYSMMEMTLDQSAESGEKYYYAVRAVDGIAIGSYYGKSHRCLAPITSEDISLSNVNLGIKITWNHIGGAEGYRIYRRVSGESNYTMLNSIDDGSVVTFTDESTVSGKTYYYYVRAYYGSALGGYDKVSILRLGTINKDDITISNISSGVKISWKKITGAKGYAIYRKTFTGTTYKELGFVTDGSTVTYTDTTAYNGSIYCYRVRAYSGTTMGSYYSKTAVRLTTPVISSLTNVASAKMTVTWNKNSKVEGYQIRYSTDSSMPSGSYKTVTLSDTETLTRTISSLTKGSKYYVKVRSYKTVGTTKYYSGWSTKKSVTISK